VDPGVFIRATGAGVDAHTAVRDRGEARENQVMVNLNSVKEQVQSAIGINRDLHGNEIRSVSHDRHQRMTDLDSAPLDVKGRSFTATVVPGVEGDRQSGANAFLSAAE